MSSAERTIGVAIGLPEPYCTQLQTWREKLGDPNAAAIPPHITLLPPMQVYADDVAEVEEHLARVAARHRAFEVHLRATGTFRPVSPVVFVMLAAGIGDCELLELSVRAGPLSRQRRRFPYHPHVTVAHDLDGPALDLAYEALASYDARFTAWDFTLWEPGVDGTWRSYRDFPFGGHLGASGGSE